MKRRAQHIVNTCKKWAVRYLPGEVAGTCTALGSSLAVHAATDSLAAAAIAGTVGENIGYYGAALCRELRLYWRRCGSRSRYAKLRFSMKHAIRGMVVEFGFAELVDTFAVRPFLLYMLPVLFPSNLVAALFAAKILADCVFYGLTFAGLQVRQRMFGKLEQGEAEAV